LVEASFMRQRLDASPSALLVVFLPLKKFILQYCLNVK
jgi:hypothetical protein